MKSFTEVVEAQGVSGQQIQQIIKNYKKDGASRKCTTEYFHRYIQRLNSCWIEFERNDNQLRQHKDIDQSHQYFTSDYYSEVKQLVEQYLEEFQQKLDLLEEKEHRSQALPMREARKQTAQEIPMQEAREQNGHAGLIRRIKASIDSLKRTAYELDHDTSGQPVQYFKVKLRFINDLWQRVEELQQEIWEKLENPTASGFDIDEYNQISDVVQQQRINLSIKLDQIESSNNVNQPALQECHGQTSLPLPKVTIPQFSGDYLKWRQFYELFSQMIDNQPIPAVQKMWYLKANVSGEAAKLVDKLLNQPSGAATAASIKGLHDTAKECVLALNNLGVDTASWDPLLLHLLIKKIDRSTHMRFEQSITNPKELLKIDEFLRFLENQFQTIEAIGQKEKISASLHAGRTVSSVVTLDKNKGNCQKCSNGNHPLYRCKQFLELSPSDRLNWVKHQGVCYNCFKGDHVAQKCNSRSCQKCNKKHNTLLHLEIKNQSRSVSDGQSGPSNEITTATSAAANTVAFNSGQILLATAKIQIKASNGNSGEFRAILDSGSQINIVSERLIKRLSIHPTEASLCIDGIGNAQRKTTQRVNLKMCSMTTSFESHLEAFVLPTIIPAQPNQSIDVSKWSIPNIQLADPEFHKQGKIDVLLGAEFYLKLLIAGQIKLAPNLPILQNSSLGWIISGKIGVNQNLTPSDSLTCAVFGLKTDNSDDPLVEVIEKMWKMDDIETNKRGLSPSEQCCEAHFAQNVRLNNEGRFIVRLPFLEHTTVLGESRELAYNRFMGLERRLLKNVEVRQQYSKFMEEFEALGHMTEISIESVMTPSYFIPHHAVLKPDSSTTKLRVVFDASAKTTSGYSLNDLMYTGPTVQDELFSILIRFRLPRFVFTTDIEKMYRQIIIHPDDRRYQIIMWRKDPASSIRYYQLNTVTYGTRAAPYLATKCLQQIASENIIKYPLGAKLLKNDFYVDDGLGGSDKLATAIETQQQLIHILKKHGFNLRKWCANHPQLLQHIPQGDQEVNLDFDNSSNESVKTLGLIWLPKTDRLCIKVRLNTVDRITKRTVSSDLAKLFDPLGLLAPVVMRAKIFIQKLWQLKLSWDEPLPSNYKETWITFRESLSNLDNLQVSRHIYYGETPVSSQLHVYADASEKAFGAAAYIRATLQDGRVMVRLLCSKTRVAPLKTQTLPRLELCAALIAAQLANRIKNDLKLSDQPIVLWTDSEIVLSWINAQSSSFQTFVANRIAKIQTLSIPEQWRHVKSQFNPADLLSRGLSTKDLALSALWFQGPMFLHGGQESWPPIFSPALEIQNNMERKKESAVVIPTTINDRNFVYQIQHKNSFAKLQRIIAYVLRFIRNTKRSTKSRPKQMSPNADELTEALNVIMKAIQAADFAKDIKCLKKQHVVDKSSSISSLSPFIDDKGIIRVGGRLEAASIPYGTKHPMLIPYNDPLAKLLFIMVHEQNMHCGPQALLGILRQRFWPIKGKCTARSTVQGCIRCNKAQPKLYEQIMGNLPKERVTPARPFITAGVDYCGPFSIHYKIRGKRATKAYIALSCCFVTKAIHLELVSDLSTDGFIGALKRFISRRGRCQNIYSDNATNFVGARNKLAELNQAIYSDESKEKIITTCSARGINFHFIPPRAPHFGGLWEAAVKSAKRLLLRTCETAALTYEELETVIIEAEAILNSRPLTPISNDPDDFTALTPGHFLIGEALTSQIDNRGEQGKRTLLSRWKLVSAIKYEFWQQWSSNYLTSLQERHKWKQNAADIKEGSLVIIKEDNVPVMHWPLGRIVQIHKGPDAVTRVVDVKTATGIFKRPVHRLALLPVEADEQEKTRNAVECHHDNEKQRIEPITKRRKMSSNNLSLTLVEILLILPLILGGPIENKKFGSKLGIHFDGIGSMAVSATEWNILVYYDLSPYWIELNDFFSGTKSLNFICQEIKMNSSCSVLINHFERMETELRLNNKMMHEVRHKRGALDVVGNVAHSLFGLLDSEYAKKMSRTIEKVKGNEVHLLSLIKNQTSIVDSTINIIKQNQVTTKMRMEKIDQEINILLGQTQHLQSEAYQVQATQLFHSSAIQLIVIGEQLRKIQASILEMLTDSHHGKISPSVLTPLQLQYEVDQISNHLPSRYELPVQEEDLLQLYKLMTVKGGFTKHHVMFTLTIPLVENKKFNVFKLISIPVWTNNTLIAIQPCSSIIAINKEHEQYILMNEAKLSSCNIVNETNFVCGDIKIRYKFGSERCACEINLFNNKTIPNCQLMEITSKTTWTPLNQKNQWIYATSSSSRATAVCEREIIPIVLKGSGLLTLQPDCLLRHNFTTLRAQRSIKSTLKTSYTKLSTLPELVSQQQLKAVFSPTNVTNSSQFERQHILHMNTLSTLQNDLKTLKLKFPSQLETHRYHSYGIGYSALALSLGLILIVWVRRIKQKKKQATNLQITLPKQDAENVPTMTPKADLSKHKDQPEEALDLQQFKINI